MKRAKSAAVAIAPFLAIVVAGAGQWALAVARQQGTPSWMAGAALLAAGAVLFAWAASAAVRRAAGSPVTLRGQRAFDAAAIVAVTAVAAIARLYRIQEIPAGLWLDETDIAKQALEILDGARPAPWEVARLEVPWLYHYYVALFYKILGPGHLTVKLPHILISILTAPALYVLARQFLDRPAALVSALLWATMRWSVNMSRWGHANSLTLFWICVVFFLLWRAQATGRWRWWIAGGIALGLSQYSYQSTRALVALAALFLAFRALRPLGYFRRSWKQVLVFWLLFAAVYAPLAGTYLQHPELFLERSRAISIFNPLFTRDPWLALQENVGKYAGVFHFQGDYNGRHNIPNEPMLDPITGVLAILGLGVVAAAPRRLAHGMLWLWLGAYLAAGILSTEAPNTFRVYALTPAIALLCGLAVDGLMKVRLPSRMGRWARNPLTWLACTTAVGGAAYLNLTAYFAVQAVHPAVVGMFNVGPTSVGRYIATLPKDAVVYLDREFWAFSPIEVINPGRPLVRLIAPDHLPPPQESAEVAYVLGNYGRQLVPYLRQLYPEARSEEILGANGAHIFTGVRVDAATASRRGLSARWWEGEEQAGEPTIVQVGMPWTPPLPGPAAGELRGGLYVPMAGDYGLRIEGVNRAMLTLAGHTILSAAGQEVTVTLPGGLLPVRLAVQVSENTPWRVLWRQGAGDGGWNPIPDQAWYPFDLPDGGLLALYFEGGGLRKPPVRVTHDATLYADNAGGLATAAMRWLGKIRIAEDGVYTFGLSSDDGARLWIDETLVVDAWDLHGARWRDGQVALTAGCHGLRIAHVDNGGYHWFEARWAPPGQNAGPLPAEVLSWDAADLAQALTAPESPVPGIPAVDASGQVREMIPIAAARLADPQWSLPVGDANFQGWPFKLVERMYDQGIGLYGPGEVDFALDAAFKRFIGEVGVDTDTYGDAHTQVQVLGDGRVLWDSGVIHPWDPPQPFDIDVTGVRGLTLRQVEEGHFEGRGDAVDWVDVRLIP